MGTIPRALLARDSVYGEFIFEYNLEMIMVGEGDHGVDLIQKPELF